MLLLSILSARGAAGQIDQSALARQIASDDFAERTIAVAIAVEIGSQNLNEELRGALIHLLEEEGRRLAVHTPGEEGSDLIGRLASLVSEFGEVRTIPALVGALGSSPAAVFALSDLGATAAEPIISAVRSADDESVVMDGLIALRLMVEAVDDRPLTPEIISDIRWTAEQRLVGRQSLTALWRGIELAIALRDPDLRRAVEMLATDKNSVIARGIEDPELIARVQWVAHEALAGVAPLPHRRNAQERTDKSTLTSKRRAVGESVAPPSLPCYTVRAVVTPAGAGTAGVFSAQDCPGGFVIGTAVAISAVPNNSNQFTSWTATKCSLSKPSAASTTCTMTGTGNATVTANFSGVEPTCFALTSSSSPTGAGTSSVSTTKTCSGGYAAGTAVAIAAVPNNGYQFTSWAATKCSLSNPSAASTTCTMTGTGNATVTANFSGVEPTCFALTSSSSPTGAGTSSVSTTKTCSGGYAAGTAVAIAAVPNNGYQFTSWAATKCSLSNPSAASTTCTMTGTGNASVTATFTAIAPTCFSLVSSASPTGAGASSVSTAQTCSGGYAAGTAVAIAAVPNNGYQFSSWAATKCSLFNPSAASTTCTMTGTGNASVTATFVAIAPTCFSLAVDVTPSGTGAANTASAQNCQGGFTAGTNIAISASPNGGYQFTTWTATNCTLANPNTSSTTCAITGNGNSSVTAHFTAVSSACYTISASATPSGTGTATISTEQNCSGGFLPGTNVAIVASPSSGYRLLGWNTQNCIPADGGALSTTCTITGPATVTAKFTPICYTMSASATPSGTGTATISTEQNCSGGFLPGTNVAIVASPSSGYRLLGWKTQNCIPADGGALSTTCTITGPAAVTAKFTLTP